jgi:16S rRNA processing protein RimM
MTSDGSVADKKQNTGTGSPSKQGEPEFLVVGKLRRPHGFKGEILMDVITDFPERLKVNKKVFVGENHEPLVIEHIRWNDQTMLVLFKDVDDKKAGELRNQYVFVKSDNLPELPEGIYYFHQLLGIDVVDENGNVLGILDEILETGANNVYVVKKPDGGEILLPAIASVVLDINLEQKTIRVRPPE